MWTELRALSLRGNRSGATHRACTEIHVGSLHHCQ